MTASPDPIRLAYGYARQLGLSREEAQDCAMDFRLHLLHSPSPPLPAAAWLHRCARNYASNYLRAQLRRQQRERRYTEQNSAGLPSSAEPLLCGPGPRTLFLRKVLWEQVMANLQHFTPEQQDLFLGYHVRQQSLSELSQRTGRTLAALTQAIYHIHRRLGRLLLAQGWSMTEARQLILSAPAAPMFPSASGRTSLKNSAFPLIFVWRRCYCQEACCRSVHKDRSHGIVRRAFHFRHSTSGRKSMTSIIRSLVGTTVCALSLFAAQQGRTQILFVSSQNTGEVKRYSSDTGAYLGNIEGGHGLDLPTGLYGSVDGSLYVGSYFSSQINRYDAGTGAFLNTFVAPNSGGLLNPTGMRFGPDGNLYVLSNGNSSVKEYNGSTGAYIRDYVQPGVNGVRPDSYDLVFGPDGSLYVSEYGNFGISKFSPTGTPEGNLVGFSGTAVAPVGLTIGPAPAGFGQTDALYVADGFINGASELSLHDGTRLGGTQFIPGNFPFTWGIQFAPNDGDLFISFANLNVVRRYNRLNGAYEGDFVSAGSGGLDFSTYIAFTTVPEPSTMALLISLSLTGAGFLAHRRRVQKPVC